MTTSRSRFIGLAFACLTLMLASRAPAQDEFRTRPKFMGRNLMEFCQPPDDGSVGMMALCYGYIEGVVDNHMMLATAMHLRPWACIPRSTSVRQLAEIVMEHLRAHPESAGYPAAGVVLRALQDYYPCSGGAN